MSAGIAYEFQNKEGWTDSTLLEICLEFISNQNSDEAFEDYLKRRTENDGERGL